MTPVSYLRADSAADAVRLGGGAGARLLGGGTNLVDLMRKGVEAPAVLVDVTGLSTAIEETPDGGLLIGAAARTSAVAAHPVVRSRYPMLARAVSRTLNCFTPPFFDSRAANCAPIASTSGTSASRRTSTLYVVHETGLISLSLSGS